MSKGKDVHPVYSMIADFVRGICKTSKVWLSAIDAAEAEIAGEFDVFVRARNYTAYQLDGLAAASARIEPLTDGGKGFTYSTMEGRRVEDIIFCVLDDISYKIHPATEQKNGKLNHHNAERSKWILSLGYTRSAVGKGFRPVFADTFAPLKDKLEKFIPERFEGTKQNLTAKQMIPLIAPARLSSETVSVNVYRPNNKEEAKNLLSRDVIAKFIADGYVFPLTKDGKPKGDTSTYYYEMLVNKVNAAAETKPKRERKAKPVQEQAPVTVTEAPPVEQVEAVEVAV